MVDTNVLVYSLHVTRSHRFSRGRRPRAPLLALLSPILSGLSRRRITSLCLAPGRVDGAAAPRWARGRSRGEGEPLAGGGAAPVGGARGGRAQKCRLNFLSALSLRVIFSPRLWRRTRRQYPQEAHNGLTK